MLKGRRIIYVITAILIIGAGYWLFFRKAEGVQINWTSAKVTEGNISVVITATGTLSAVTTVQVGTQVSGIIDKIYVDYNSVVRKGEVAARIDRTLLLEAIKDTRANLLKTESQLLQADNEYQRLSRLMKVEGATRSDYDVALANYKAAQANVISAKAQLSRALTNLNYATIYAPISGTVISRNVDVGQTVAASFNTPTLFVIANDLTKMQVLASVDEADIGQVKNNQQIFFSVDAYPGKVLLGRCNR